MHNYKDMYAVPAYLGSVAYQVQKRPTIEAKETYYRGKRDLL